MENFRFVFIRIAVLLKHVISKPVQNSNFTMVLIIVEFGIYEYR